MLRDQKFRPLSLAGLGLCALLALIYLDRSILSSKPTDAASKQAPLEAESHYAAQRADLCGAGNAIGVGLKGEYFSAPDYAGKLNLTRTDKLIDFDSSFDAGPELALGKPRSVRWTGWIKPPLSGRYRFHLDAPGATVTIARQIVSGPGAQPEASVEMAIGRFYPITIEVRNVDPTYAGRWSLEWTAPHGMRYVVPTALLFMPTGSTS